MIDNDNFYGYLLLAMIAFLSLVLLGVGAWLWFEAFALGNRLVVFVSGMALVVGLNVTAVVIGKNFKISRREKKQ